MKKIYLILTGVALSAGLAQAQVKTASPAGDVYGGVQSVGTVVDYKAVESGAVKILPTIGSQSGAQNVAINNSHSNIKNLMNTAQANPLYEDKGMSGKNPLYEGSQRLLPTVNKRESSAPSVSEESSVKARAAIIVHGWDSEKKENVDNLEKNLEAAVDADENIQHAEIAPDAVKIEYKDSAKLFGFIPIAFNHAFTVDGKGNVSSGHPWWLIFAKTATSTDSFETDAIHIYQHNETNLEFLKTQTQIQLMNHYFQALAGILKKQHDTAMSIIANIK